MEIGERVSNIREKFCDGNNLKFAEMMNESPTTVSNWANANSLGGNVIKKLLTKFETINARWLITGEGDMLKVDKSDVDSVGLVDELKSEIESLKEENASLRGENRILRELAGLGVRKDKENKEVRSA